MLGTQDCSRVLPARDSTVLVGRLPPSEPSAGADVPAGRGGRAPQSRRRCGRARATEAIAAPPVSGSLSQHLCDRARPRPAARARARARIWRRRRLRRRRPVRRRACLRPWRGRADRCPIPARISTAPIPARTWTAPSPPEPGRPRPRRILGGPIPARHSSDATDDAHLHATGPCRMAVRRAASESPAEARKLDVLRAAAFVWGWITLQRWSSVASLYAVRMLHACQMRARMLRAGIIAPLGSVRAGSPASHTNSCAYTDACTCVVSRRTAFGPESRAAQRRALQRAWQPAAAAAHRGRASAQTYAPTGSSPSRDNHSIAVTTLLPLAAMGRTLRPQLIHHFGVN
jgi:hypothetical protein